MKKTAKSVLNKCWSKLKKSGNQSNDLEKIYMQNGCIPWSKGYIEYKNRIIKDVLSNPEFITYFKGKTRLPEQYGVGLDERCIEYPWFFANAKHDAKVYLDAGSALNHQFILENDFWNDKSLTIFTLAPEACCFWNKKISYNYGDLRQLPYRDNWFDEIACISTLEHVGMDNSNYSPADNVDGYDMDSFQSALSELNRILKSGGRFLLTVPFGKYQNFRKFQQFDKDLLGKASTSFGAIEQESVFYRYSKNGWQIASVDECAECEYSSYAVSVFNRDTTGVQPEEDNASAARSVACVIWQKE